MSDPRLTFGDLQVTEYAPTLTLEDSIKRCASLAGVSHSYNFQKLIESDFTTLDELDTAGATGTWESSFSWLSGTGGGTPGTFYTIQHNVEIPPSFVVSFVKQGDVGGFTVLDNNYLFSWNETHVAISKLRGNGTIESVLDIREVVLEDYREVKVCVQYQGMSQFDIIDWVSISAYQSERCLIGASRFIYVPDMTHPDLPAYNRPGYTEQYDNYVGFATWGGETCKFTNFSVDELHQIRQWTSVDPGETVGQGLSRVVGTTPVFYFVRHDGTLAAWIPEDRDLDWNVPIGRGTRHEERSDYFVPTRIRMVGAYYEAESYDAERMQRGGRELFELPQDPNLMTVEEAAIGGDRTYREIEEGGELDGLQIPAHPLLEPHDRIEFDGEDLRVKAIQLSIVGPSGTKAPVASMAVEVQEYIEAE